LNTIQCSSNFKTVPNKTERKNSLHSDKSKAFISSAVAEKETAQCSKLFENVFTHKNI